MDTHSKTLRIGAAAILCALFLRLGAAGLWRRIENWISDRDTQAFLIYLETGRNVRFSPSNEELSNYAGESPAPVLPQPEAQVPAALPVFAPEDTALLDIRYSCSQRPDLESMLTAPLRWNLAAEEPRVLILHTHTTESYTKTSESYEETSAFRTLDERYNMLSVGDALAQVLEASGIPVIHDREIHDYPSYNGSYAHARRSIQAYLKENPSVCLVLDLHRDASGDLNNQFRPRVTVDGESAAQLMLVMGAGHDRWEDNLSLGVKLHAQLERIAPGITRPISLRSQRFNQDLSTGALLIEVGAAGNTHDEAIRAARVLAQAILALSRGSEESPGP